MSDMLFNHVGFLVADLEEAVQRWEAATGYTFRPPSRYIVDDYRDSDNPAPHESNVRLAFSVQGPPYIELMEFEGTGTHSSEHGEGWHHLGFYDPELEARVEDLDAQGIGLEASAFDASGHRILCFSDAADFYGVRMEFGDPAIEEPWFDEATGRRLEI
jgi:catechol 2,3-dioxygenase-like lactoylglutathione lyase family enzyme